MIPRRREIRRDEQRFSVQAGTLFLATQKVDALAASWTRVPEVRDISSSGIAFRADAYFEPASTLWVTLTGTERLAFKVVYCLLNVGGSGYRCGIKVLDAEPNLLSLVKDRWALGDPV